MNSYETFLRKKIATVDQFGFDVDDSEIHPILKPHQRAIVQWAVRGGRRALFESFGLGKTVQQLEIVRLILTKAGDGNGLIVCPLGVRQEFKRDARMLGLDVHFIRSNDEIMKDAGPLIYLTNYESIREGKLDPSGFTADLSRTHAAVRRHVDLSVCCNSYAESERIHRTAQLCGLLGNHGRGASKDAIL